MSSKIEVELKNGAVCQMAKQSFNVFLSLGKVVRFRRCDGWIVVGKGPLRDMEKNDDYPAIADRRSAL